MAEVEPLPVNQLSSLTSSSSFTSSPPPLPPSPPPDPDEAVCRICHLPSGPTTPLSSPCRCSGTIEHVHEACLLLWLSKRSSTACELCGYRFQFSPVYAPGAPSSPSVLDAAWGALRWVAQTVPLCVRAAVVGLVWLFVVPLLTWWLFVMYHGCAASLSPSSAASALFVWAEQRPPLSSLNGALGVWLESQYGLLVCLIVVLLTLSGVGIRSVVKSVREGDELERQAHGRPLRAQRAGEDADAVRRRAARERHDANRRARQQPRDPVQEPPRAQQRMEDEAKGDDHRREQRAALYLQELDLQRQARAHEEHVPPERPEQGDAPTEVERKEAEHVPAAEAVEALPSSDLSPSSDSSSFSPSTSTSTSSSSPSPTTSSLPHSSSASLSLPTASSSSTSSSAADPAASPAANAPAPEAVGEAVPTALPPPLPVPAAAENLEPVLLPDLPQPAPGPEPLPLPPPPVAEEAVPPAAAAVAGDAADDWMVEFDDVPLSHWLGFGGPLRFFLLHVTTILVYNAFFLFVTFFLPLLLGRIITSATYALASLSVSRSAYDSVAPLLAPLLYPVQSWMGLARASQLVAYAWALLSASSSTAFHPSRLDVFALLCVGYGTALGCALVVLVLSASSRVLSLVGLSASYHLMLLKLSVMIVVKLVLYPTLHGVLIDLSTAPLFTFSIASRWRFSQRHPFASLFLHWAMGFLLILLISFFVSVLKRVVRRPVLRSTLGVFLRYAADDPHHHLQPFADMVRLGWALQFWRTLKTSALMVAAIVLGLAVPVKLVDKLGGVWPLREGTARTGESGLEVPVDLLLVHFLLPLMLERMAPRWGVMTLARWWLHFLCTQLRLGEYVLLPVTPPNQPAQAAPVVAVVEVPPQPPQLEVIPEPAEELQEVPVEAPVEERLEEPLGPVEMPVEEQAEAAREELVAVVADLPEAVAVVNQEAAPAVDEGIREIAEEKEQAVEAVVPAAVAAIALADPPLPVPNEMAEPPPAAVEAVAHDAIVPAPAPEPAVAAAAPADGGAAVAGEALEAEALSADRIPHFYLRMFLLVLALWVTHIVLFFVVFVSPLLTGRVVVSYVYPFSRLLDAYTWLVGVNLQLGLVALCRRVAPYLSRHLPPVSVVDVVRQSSVVVARCVVVAVPLLLVIPLLTGILMELLVFLPLRSLPVLALSPVQADVSASSGAFSVFHAAGRMFSSFLVLQDWAFGMVMLKAVGRLVMTAGDGEWLWRGRVRVERVRRDGWKRVDVAFFYSAIIGPILYQLVLHIAVPLVAVLLLWPLHALLPHGRAARDPPPPVLGRVPAAEPRGSVQRVADGGRVPVGALQRVDASGRGHAAPRVSVPAGSAGEDGAGGDCGGDGGGAVSVAVCAGTAVRVPAVRVRPAAVRGVVARHRRAEAVADAQLRGALGGGQATEERREEGQGRRTRAACTIEFRACHPRRRRRR